MDRKAAWVRATFVAALAVTSAACDGGGATPASARDLVIVSMATPEVELAVGEQAQLVASARNGSSSAPVESWASSDPNVASVSAAGSVAGLREGDVTVTATYRGATGVATVKVRRKDIARVAIKPKSLSLGALGDTARLTGTAYDPSGAVISAVIGFSTPDTQVVSVTGDGKVTARGTGLARVIAQTMGKADTSMISVVQIVAAVALSPTAQTLQTGQSTVLQAAARDSGGAPIAGASFAWSSTNPAAVTVDPNGTIHGVGAGSATIAATAAGANAVAGTAAVSVQTVPIATLAVSPATVSLAAGGTQQLVAVAKDASGNVLTGRVVTWSTSNAGVASVSPLGVVFALAAGSATITATSEGKTATAAATVSAPPTTTTSVGLPQPQSGDQILVDTRAGAAGSIQGAAITTIDQALAAAGMGRGAEGYTGPGALGYGRVDLTTNYDGAGTHAFRFNWTAYAGNPGGCGGKQDSDPANDGIDNVVSEHDLKIYGNIGQAPGSTVFLQYKVWWGRTATGGGTGRDAVGAFTHYNTARGSGHKMMVIKRLRADGTVGAARIDVYAGTVESQGMSVEWYNDAAAGSGGGGITHYSSPLWNPNANLNRPVTITIRLKSESSASANDGQVQIWADGTSILNLSNADFGTDGWDWFEVGGPTWICAVQDQTQYVWDVLAWRR